MIFISFGFVSKTIAGDLSVLNSRHYVIHTDLDRALAEDLARRMDAMHDEYERRLSDFAGDAKTPRLEAYLFQSKRDYDRLTENRFPNTGGIFMAGERNLLAAFLETQGRDALRRTLQHEAFHQFCFMQISKNLPTWINEGMAQLFEEGIWTGNGFTIGQVPPRRLRQLQADMKAKRLTDFRTFVTIGDSEWQARLASSADRGAAQYNQAWAMTHFLVYSKPTFRERLLKMLKNLHTGAAPDRAFEQAFSANYEGFQKMFLEWASSLSATAEATQIENQQVLADMLVALNKQGARFESVRQFQSALENRSVKLQYSKGNLTWTTSDPKTYFADSTGRPLSHEELFFTFNQGHPIPDLVRRCEGIRVRTIFYSRAGGLEHETVFE